MYEEKYYGHGLKGRIRVYIINNYLNFRNADLYEKKNKNYYK